MHSDWLLKRRKYPFPFAIRKYCNRYRNTWAKNIFFRSVNHKHIRHDSENNSYLLRALWWKHFGFFFWFSTNISLLDHSFCILRRKSSLDKNKLSTHYRSRNCDKRLFLLVFIAKTCLPFLTWFTWKSTYLVNFISGHGTSSITS